MISALQFLYPRQHVSFVGLLCLFAAGSSRVGAWAYSLWSLISRPVLLCVSCWWFSFPFKVAKILTCDGLEILSFSPDHCIGEH